ncbi:MAG: hypothetical protein AB1522_00750 [Chloroflexota bacterium]
MKLNRFEVLLSILVVAVHLTIVFAPINGLLDRWFTTDDAFYYFQVARNISDGKGSTLDGINPSNGYHPLWMMVLVPVFSLARVDLFLPLRIVILISAILSLGTGIFIYRFLSRFIRQPLAMLTATVWVFFPPLHRVVTQLGMEAGINAFFVMVLLWQVSRFVAKPPEQSGLKDRLLLGLLAALALFSRLDNIFLVLAVGLVAVFREKRFYIFWLFFIFAGLSSIYLAFFTRIGFPRFLTDFQSTLYAMVLIGMTLKLGIGFWLGLFSPFWDGWRKEFFRIILLSGVSAAIGGVILLGLNQSGLIGSFPRSVIFWDFVYTAGIFLPTRWLSTRLVERPKEKIPPLTFLKQNLRTALVHGLGYSLPVVILLSVYFGINLLLFGTPTPVSGQIKHWWGTIPDVIYGRPVDSIPALFGLFGNWEQSPWWLILLPISRLTVLFGQPTDGQLFFLLLKWGLMAGWVGVLLAGIRMRIIRQGLAGINLILPLTAACVMQILYYTGSYYVNLRPWYWVNESLVGLLVMAFSLEGWLSFLPARLNNEKWIKVFCLSTGALVFGWSVLWLLNNFIRDVPEQPAYYLREAEELERQTPPQSRIGMPGGGSAAYFIRERTIINLDGLINSYSYFQHLKANRGGEFLERLGLDYVFGNPGMVEHSAPYYNLLANRLEPVMDIFDFRLYRFHSP